MWQFLFLNITTLVLSLGRLFVYIAQVIIIDDFLDKYNETYEVFQLTDMINKLIQADFVLHIVMILFSYSVGAVFAARIYILAFIGNAIRHYVYKKSCDFDFIDPETFMKRNLASREWGIALFFTVISGLMLIYHVVRFVLNISA